MKHDQVIDFLLRKTGEILRDNLPARVPDTTVVRTIRALISTPTAQTALEQGSDTVRAFAVRAMNRVLSDQSRPPRETVSQLWNIMDGQDLRGATQASARTTSWVKKPPAG
jgi:hypothetical protein